MTDREKLIKLIDEAAELYPSELYAIADHLISHDVTVQRWIPASEPPKTPGEYIVKIQSGVAATTLLFNGIGGWYEMDYGELVYFPVTHWMPLPELPEEEEE